MSQPLLFEASSLFSTEGEPGVARAPVMVAYGAGLNSTAMCVGLVEKGLRPDAILFADTGGEKPETYAHIEEFSRWLESKGFPTIVTVRNDGKYGTLEENCLQLDMLPSLAYGGRSCSEKYKQRPQHKWTKSWGPARSWWGLTEAGRRPKEGCKGNVIKLIGYDAGEYRRGSITYDDFYFYVYPLKEWGWTRDDCTEAVRRAGLEPPPKSSCFFCPAMKKHEVLELRDRHPDLLARALEIERRAMEGGNLKSTKGLNRSWSWAKYLEGAIERAPDAHDGGCICQGQIWEDESIDLDEEECSLDKVQEMTSGDNEVAANERKWAREKAQKEVSGNG